MNKIILIALMAGAVFAAGCATKDYTELAQCLTANGAVMYGTDWCSHCQDQKAKFGKGFEHVNYVNCDKEKQKCLEAGIRGYPTWIVNGVKYSGTQSLSRLASLAECEI